MTIGVRYWNMIVRALHAAHNCRGSRGSKGKKIVISAVLGDPTTLIAGVVGALMSRA
ncbi:transmembrane protein, putative [Medicago truncatula]|uniref:Transmembrane protein, putative n=1 Tax=Medicago truncatula TaxID=3880 RepID=A0A072TIB5_MEDTR|nr:transmembrane protein, putative [Medicago truncatula]